MRQLTAFENVTLDGFFADDKGGLQWAHRVEGDVDNSDYDAFVANNAKGGDTLVLGRVTYDMMASFWPTPQAAAMMPDVAKGMNAMKKIVISRSLKDATWANSTVIRRDMEAAIRELKAGEGGGMTILGSGTIVSQLAKEGLIDEFHLVVNPVILGHGKPLFSGVPDQLPLTLTASRQFANGKTLLSYARKD